MLCESKSESELQYSKYNYTIQFNAQIYIMHQHETKGSDDEIRKCCKKVFYRMKEKMNRTKEETSVVKQWTNQYNGLKLIMKKQDERVLRKT